MSSGAPGPGLIAAGGILLSIGSMSGLVLAHLWEDCLALPVGGVWVTLLPA